MTPPTTPPVLLTMTAEEFDYIPFFGGWDIVARSLKAEVRAQAAKVEALSQALQQAREENQKLREAAKRGWKIGEEG